MKQDRIAESKELLSVPSLGKLMGVAVVETDHPQWTSAVPLPARPDGVTIDLKPEEGDWQGADQIVAALYVPPGVKPYAHIRVDCESSTPGLQGNDYMHCYYRYLHEGWGRLEFPYENMLIFGIPYQWRQVARVRLTLRGEGEGDFLCAGLWVEQRDRVVGPRLTDEELFAELRLDGPGLQSVRQPVEQGELDRAQEALVAYYQARTRPQHPFPTQPTPDSSYDRQSADRICKHYILNQQLGPEIDWRANPVGYLEWMHAFNRHFFLQTLVEAYLATADGKYARELDYLLSTWLDANPVPLGNNGGGDPAWETLSTACRINHAWPAAWYALGQSRFCQRQTRLDMLKSFYEHAEHLIRYPTGHNWLVAESAALATIGFLFPEFEKAERWRAVGMERLEREMQYQVYPDGAQFELSPGYHRMCMNLFANVYELAALNGHPVSRAFEQGLESMFEYSISITRPDGTRPSLNDAGSLDTGSASELLRGQALFSREDLLYVATSGQQGKLPAGLSRAFPYAGHYVMRTGWDRDALWALVDAGPYGAAHQHEDKLNLELFAYGTRFIVDPGIASYLDDPWTHYSRSTAAHNTVLVDGRGQDRRSNVPRERYRVERPEEALWGSGKHVDWLWAPYQDGYAGIDGSANLAGAGGLVHSRLVLFVKPRFWVIWDTLSGQGEHEMSVLYHFAPMLVQYHDQDGTVRSNRLGLANMELLPLGTPGGVEIACGQQVPVQGWLAIDGKIVPAPTAIYTLQGQLPLSFGVVAAPFQSGVTSGLCVEQVGREPGAGLEVTIADASGDRFDIVFDERVREIACRDIAAEAQGMIVWQSRGEVRYAAGLNCRQLRVGSLPLATRGQPEPLLELEIDVGGTK
jgi:hypothetical protein